MLDEERKRMEADRDYITNQSKRIRDLMKLQQSALKQLEEERLMGHKLREEIQFLKSASMPKKLVLLGTPDSDRYKYLFYYIDNNYRLEIIESPVDSTQSSPISDKIDHNSSLKAL
jgi:hypothetical protein